jgi:hypothetical protein
MNQWCLPPGVSKGNNTRSDFAFPTSPDSHRLRNGFEDLIGRYAKYEFDGVPEMI